MLVNAIVLAAGQSSRMGSEKALLSIEGRPLIAHHVERYSMMCQRVVVVVRPELSLRVQLALSGLALEQVDILALVTGSPAESLSRAVQHLNDDAAALVTPVDLLPAGISTVRRLLAAFEDAAVLAVTPSHGSRGGHPVALRSELLQTYRNAQGVELPTLRQVLQRAGARRARVEVDDPRVLGDFDTPADLRGLQVPFTP